ncbi:type III secretion system export apparatus subunit SctS [Prosthecobacter vanneervenii]|uniref:Type III secretion HrpO family protein n=1 Tax=Prosthecobacter vanneervenii TaxID=48466 RepID=A0A7W8DII6_9BACT|nr:type III secretion system export apparatus subunit SctS [Prosthecobacter vanneervenii]MBB5031219.1 type III secretion HrpO family protein [Prosthecobacter vanneervenii]
MNQNLLIEFTNQALILVLLLSMPPIIVATVVGVLVSLVQALTQVQEQTLGFAIKLVVVAVVLLVTAGWTGAEMYKYTVHIFETFPTLQR